MNLPRRKNVGARRRGPRIIGPYYIIITRPADPGNVPPAALTTLRDTPDRP
jgi:hypothetical protein